MDFIELKPIKDFLDMFDHSAVLWEQEPIQDINTFFLDNFRRVVTMKKNPTAENMSALLAKYVLDLLNTKKKPKYPRKFEINTQQGLFL